MENRETQPRTAHATRQNMVRHLGTGINDAHEGAPGIAPQKQLNNKLRQQPTHIAPAKYIIWLDTDFLEKCPNNEQERLFRYFSDRVSPRSLNRPHSA